MIFASFDLTVGTLYCFNFLSTASQTGNTDQKTGTISTATSTGGVIDTKSYNLTIVSDDQIRVTAAGEIV